MTWAFRLLGLASDGHRFLSGTDDHYNSTDDGSHHTDHHVTGAFGGIGRCVDYAKLRAEQCYVPNNVFYRLN